MGLIEIFSIILIHWFADFVMQDEKWALGKSKNWGDLLNHTFTYSTIWMILICPLFAFYCKNLTAIDYILKSVIFAFVTLITHTLTDYFTSRIVSKRFENKYYGSSIPNFGAFTIIGIDQVIHYFQLFGTYYLLRICKST